MTQESKIANITNTFMPDCRTKIVSVNYIIESLKWGFVHFYRLPKEIQEKVTAELRTRREGKSAVNRAQNLY